MTKPNENFNYIKIFKIKIIMHQQIKSLYHLYPIKCKE